MRSQVSRFHYFDYNATHPPLTDIMIPIYKTYGKEYFNASGASKFSLYNQSKIEDARNFFKTNDYYPTEGHIFSSTGSEANYILMATLKAKYPNLVAMYTSSSEHSSFYSAMKYYEIQPILIHTDLSGCLNLNHLNELMKNKPHPIGVIYACSDTGVIQPIKEISEVAANFEMPLVSDCMQAFGKILIDYNLLDGYTCSGHKIGGGMGASLTAVKSKLIPNRIHFVQGGNQENGLRAGTENLPAIQSFAEVARHQLLNWGGTVYKNLMIQRDLTEFLKSLDVNIIAENSPRIPNTIFALLPIDELDFFLIGMEERNVIVSTGSSCKSRTREANPNLLNMGYTEEEALKAIRISWGSETIQRDVEVLKDSIQYLLKILK